MESEEKLKIKISQLEDANRELRKYQVGRNECTVKRIFHEEDKQKHPEKYIGEIKHEIQERTWLLCHAAENTQNVLAQARAMRNLNGLGFVSLSLYREKINELEKESNFLQAVSIAEEAGFHLLRNRLLRKAGRQIPKIPQEVIAEYAEEVFKGKENLLSYGFANGSVAYESIGVYIRGFYKRRDGKVIKIIEKEGKKALNERATLYEKIYNKACELGLNDEVKPYTSYNIENMYMFAKDDYRNAENFSGLSKLMKKEPEQKK